MSSRILIADDTKTWLIFHEKTIRELYGSLFDITVCASASEALGIIRKNVLSPFDVIITDLQMEDIYPPLTAGEWLIQNIRTITEYQNSNIIIISAMSNIEFIAKRLNVECISKQHLLHNKLLFKYTMEKLMPDIKNIDNN